MATATKDKEIKITNVVLQIGGKTIELSVEDAKKLRDALSDLFQKEVVREEHHHHDYHRYPWWWGYSRSTYASSNAKFSMNAQSNTLQCMVK